LTVTEAGAVGPLAVQVPVERILMEFDAELFPELPVKNGLKHRWVIKATSFLSFFLLISDSTVMKVM
jgi:hypothetical protein